MNTLQGWTDSTLYYNSFLGLKFDLWKTIIRYGQIDEMRIEINQGLRCFNLRFDSQVTPVFDFVKSYENRKLGRTYVIFCSIFVKK